MDDENVLNHLLKVEAEAATLVNDAQGEADRRIAEGEKQNRMRYDELYGGEAAAKEAACGDAIKKIRDDYQNQIAEYRKGLGSVKTDEVRFRSLLDNFLTKD
jgi:regulator of protease activity HflC (stomatin/prohibitin superfamily)